MTQHDDSLYFGHMLHCAHEALLIKEGKSLEEFRQNIVLRFALARLVQTIGEAALRISPLGQESICLSWSEIIGMRNKIVHGCINFDYDIVWQTAEDDLPNLIQSLSGVTSR